MRPIPGTSTGPQSSEAPRSPAALSEASRSGTPAYASQWGGAPAAAAASGSTITPPTGPSELIHIV